MKGITASVTPALHATVRQVGARNIAALAHLLDEGDGVVLVRIHKGTIVKYARVGRELELSPAELETLLGASEADPGPT